MSNVKANIGNGTRGQLCEQWHLVDKNGSKAWLILVHEFFMYNESREFRVKEYRGSYGFFREYKTQGQVQEGIMGSI